MISVISASYGGYDNPNPPPQLEGVCTTMVSDDSEFLCRAMDVGWQNCVIHEIPHVHPRLAAKVAKCDPTRFMFDCPTETVVWLDASAHVRNSQRFADVVNAFSAHDAIAQFVHPDRSDIAEEAFVSATMEKYKSQKVCQQAALYKRRGLPDDWGLWATGMIVYHPNAFDLGSFGNAWLAEQVAWTYQDQISEPYLLWLAGYRPAPLPGNLRDNGFVEWMPHTRND
jgi:hypothetical protein